VEAKLPSLGLWGLLPQRQRKRAFPGSSKRKKKTNRERQEVLFLTFLYLLARKDTLLCLMCTNSEDRSNKETYGNTAHTQRGKTLF